MAEIDKPDKATEIAKAQQLTEIVYDILIPNSNQPITSTTIVRHDDGSGSLIRRQEGGLPEVEDIPQDLKP
jgi:hypothetical protein